VAEAAVPIPQHLVLVLLVVRVAQAVVDAVVLTKVQLLVYQELQIQVVAVEQVVDLTLAVLVAQVVQELLF
jgi:hypothetical protein